MALLEKFDKPTVAPMARAVIRSVSTAVDVWPAAAEPLIKVVRAVGGLDPVEGAEPALAADVESDATWCLAMAALLAALRAGTVDSMGPHLEEASGLFKVAADFHDRADAVPMVGIINALRELLAAILAGDPMSATVAKPLSAKVLAGIHEQTLRFSIDSDGLDHWFGDRKRVMLAAWAALAVDLDRMRSELGKDGFYQAEVIIDNLLNIYMSSRTFRVGGRAVDGVGVQDLIQPLVEPCRAVVPNPQRPSSSTESGVAAPLALSPTQCLMSTCSRGWGVPHLFLRELGGG